MFWLFTSSLSGSGVGFALITPKFLIFCRIFTKNEFVPKIIKSNSKRVYAGTSIG